MKDALRKPLRIAYYGLVKEKQGGSGGSANYLILEELLKRGHQIDCYAWKDYNDPIDLLEYNNFSLNYIISNRPFLGRFQSLIQKLRGQLKAIVESISYELFIHNLAFQDAKKNIIENHLPKPYDLVLFLDIHSPFKISGLPIVSWPQGASRANWLYLQKYRDTIISLCGGNLYFKTMFFYFMKERRIRVSVLNFSPLI